MILHVDSDAVYNVIPKARSRIAGYYHLAGTPNISQQNLCNGPLLIECKTMRHVVALAVEVDIGGFFRNAQTSISLRVMLEALDHLQLPTSIRTDNATAHGFIYENINLKNLTVGI